MKDETPAKTIELECTFKLSMPASDSENEMDDKIAFTASCVDFFARKLAQIGAVTATIEVKEEVITDEF